MATSHTDERQKINPDVFNYAKKLGKGDHMARLMSDGHKAIYAGPGSVMFEAKLATDPVNELVAGIILVVNYARMNIREETITRLHPYWAARMQRS